MIYHINICFLQQWQCLKYVFTKCSSYDQHQAKSRQDYKGYCLKLYSAVDLSPSNILRREGKNQDHSSGCRHLTTTEEAGNQTKFSCKGLLSAPKKDSSRRFVKGFFAPSGKKSPNWHKSKLPAFSVLSRRAFYHQLSPFLPRRVKQSEDPSTALWLPSWHLTPLTVRSFAQPKIRIIETLQNF